jgi:peptidoglycan/LPS O-acetylase OafA/YrhL
MEQNQEKQKPKTAKATKEYFEVVDGLRGASMMATVLIHMNLTIFKVPAFIAHFGLHGFYILSAFLISTILYKEKEKFGAFKPYAKNFYIKRFLRIFPVYYAYIIFMVIVGVILKATHNGDPFGIIYELKHFGINLITFTYNYKDIFAFIQGLNHHASNLFPHLWSISIEEQFYLFIPAIIFFLSKEQIRKMAIAFIIFYPFIRVGGFLYLRDVVEMKTTYGKHEYESLYNFFYRASVFQVDAFMYGLMIPLATYNNRFVLRMIVIVTTVLLFSAQIYNMFDYASEIGVPVWTVVGEHVVVIKNGMYIYLNTLYNILAATLFYYLLKYPDSFVNRPLRANIFKSWGRIVYGIYVYHMVFVTIAIIIYKFILIKYIPVVFSELISIVICFSLTYYFAKFSFYKFEMYFLMLKSKRD